jgi:hypothetical protein
LGKIGGYKELTVKKSRIVGRLSIFEGLMDRGG